MKVNGTRARSGTRSRSRTPPPPVEQAMHPKTKKSKSMHDDNTGRSGSPPQESPSSFRSAEDAINYFIERPSLPVSPPRLNTLSQEEIEELERVFEFSSRGEGWRDSAALLEGHQDGLICGSADRCQ